jgi:uncharacterized protein (TIGR02270 family)
MVRIEDHAVSHVSRAVVPVVVEQHVDDAALLCDTRARLLSAPHIKLHHLRRVDDRLAAHLDGLRIAGEGGQPALEAALESPTPGAIFVAAARALEDGRPDRLDRYIALAATTPEWAESLCAALGWLDPAALRGVVADWLKSSDPSRRFFGIAATSMHRVNPALGPARRLEDPDLQVRARAFRTAGELGQREFLSRLGQAAQDDNPACRFWAAWSAVLLGDRQQALDVLEQVSIADGAFRQRAFDLAMIAFPNTRAHEYLRALASDPNRRWLIEGAGRVGDPTYVPWLIKQMSDDGLARLAGQALSLITGADLAWLDLERKPPETPLAGPNDDPNDPNVAMDEDDDLPWPDVERVERWWAQHSSRFVPGQRFFVGAPVTREHCIEVLRTGYQRQRILAAHHLCLLEPGSVLFEWRAPAWRQSQALAALV